MTRPRNDTLLRALCREPTEYTPIWLMRQAGRYLPEYRETRQRAGSFLRLCKSPGWACEVALQPLARYRLDAAILFSDILTVPDAMGLGLHFVDGEGPKFEHPLREEEAIMRLGVPDPGEHLRYVTDAVGEIRRALGDALPLLGFSGSPFTLACYMVEGGSSRDFHDLKKMMYARPDLMHRILSVTADAVAAYLNAQIKAGVHAVMLFDTWGGILSAAAYREFSLPYLRRVASAVLRENDNERVPLIIFAKGAGLWLEALAETGCDAIAVDWSVDLGDARHRVGRRVALQGNLDPAVLLASPERIAHEAGRVMASYGDGGGGYVFNLGHGIIPATPPEHVAALVDTVRSYRRPADCQALRRIDPA